MVDCRLSPQSKRTLIRLASYPDSYGKVRIDFPSRLLIVSYVHYGLFFLPSRKSVKFLAKRKDEHPTTTGETVSTRLVRLGETLWIIHAHSLGCAARNRNPFQKPIMMNITVSRLTMSAFKRHFPSIFLLSLLSCIDCTFEQIGLTIEHRQSPSIIVRTLLALSALFVSSRNRSSNLPDFRTDTS